MARTTLSDKLVEAAGRPSGFDYIRVVLAVSVIVRHSPVLCYGKAVDAQVQSTIIGPMGSLIVPMFFALSGYLVAGSFERSHSLVRFLGLRFIRIYPALMVEVVISALVLGPMLTTLPLQGYFINSLFFQYLLNVTGDIHYLLPGVFFDNPYPRIVNPQLWTVPFELVCYVAITVLMLIGLRRYPWIAFAAAFAGSLAYVLAEFVMHHGGFDEKIGAVHSPALVAGFLFGVGFYLYNKAIPWSFGLCVASGVAALAMLSVPYGEYLSALLAAYFTISLGSFNPRRLWMLRGADYSYGIYLYGAVIQQTLVALFPSTRIWWLNVIVTIPIAAIIAALSWHFIEKPALRLRAFLPKSLPRAQLHMPPETSGATPVAAQ